MIRTLLVVVWVNSLLILASANEIAKRNNETSQVSKRNSELHHGDETAVCSDEIKAFQIEHMDLVGPHICDAEGMATPWQLTHLVYPDLKVFLDIGGNRGYTAAEIFGTWTPGHGLNRKNLYTKIKQDAGRGLYNNTDQLDTYCGDGVSRDYPIICIGRVSHQPCNYRRSIQVYSFDGQTTHVTETRGTIYRHFPQVNPNYTINTNITHTKASWEYIHAAMTDTVPEGEKFGYFKIETHETGQLIKDQKKASPETNLVPLLTVDMFCEQRKLPLVPVLKVDAEGSDDLVIYGAEQTLLHRGVKVISFECWDCMGDKMKKLVETLDSKFGFDCYQVGQFNLFMKLTNCWDYSYATKPSSCDKNNKFKCSEFERRHMDPASKIDGNTFCVHRKRGAVLHALIESISLHKFYAENRGDVNKDALLANSNAMFDRLGQITFSDTYDAGVFHRRTGRHPITGEKTTDFSPSSLTPTKRLRTRFNTTNSGGSSNHRGNAVGSKFKSTNPAKKAAHQEQGSGTVEGASLSSRLYRKFFSSKQPQQESGE